MFWRRKQKDPIETCADVLYSALKGAVTQGARIRVEELISAAAAIVGEAAIAKAGDFDPRRHDHPPGARVFSTNIIQLICDDKSFQEAPTDSIVGDLRERLVACGFSQSDSPKLEDVFKHFVIVRRDRRRRTGRVLLDYNAGRATNESPRLSQV
jgi:hypothetical protein